MVKNLLANAGDLGLIIGLGRFPGEGNGYSLQKNSKKTQERLPQNQCKEIEENNRMGKTRDRFKNIRDTEGIFHAKMGTIKDRNTMDLTEA